MIHHLRHALLYLITCFLPFSAQAYSSLVDTGEILNRGYSQVQLESQYLLNSGGQGLNFNGRYSTNLRNDSDLQIELGLGSVDFSVGAFWKWVPFPDTASQPAVGSRFGVSFAKVNGKTTYGLLGTPLVSKKISMGYLGHWSPYVGIPIGLQNTNESTFMTLQGLVGFRYTYKKWNHLHFLLEYSMNILNAFDHVSLAVSYDI